MESKNESALLDAKVTRRRFLNCFDLITVEDPELIKRIELSGVVDRPHVEESKNVSKLLRWFFDASKFHSARQDKWFLGMEPTKKGKTRDDPEYERRIAFINRKLNEGFSEGDVKKMLDAIETATDEELWKAGIELVNYRWMRDHVEVPQSIARDTSITLDNIRESLNPFKRKAGYRSTERVASWVKNSMVPGYHVGDGNHSVHTASQSVAPLLKEYLTSRSDQSFKDFLIKKIPVPTLVRTAVKASRLEDVLRVPLKKPMIPYKTIVIYSIGKAAKKTGDDKYIFGAGVNVRQCPFRSFFYSFIEQAESRQSRDCCT